MACVIMAMLLHPVWSYFLVSQSQFNLGITGTGIAGLITNFSILLFNMIYTSWLPEIKDAVFMPDKRSYNMKGIYEYLVIGIPSTIMVCLDAYANCLATFFAGYLSMATQSAQVVLMNIMVVLFFMCGAGIQSAACAIIGQLIG